ncbi:MAG: recombination protein O N-terminal domain-containing protein [Bacteroidales bacterium]|nr:recombination protein O N-terminal domain-containing protein [Bacteroidales bacterium]
MIYQARGIVLHKTDFADNKAIFHVYTMQEGMRSYMAYTSLKKGRKGQWTKMQPLAVVELKAERRGNGNVDYLKSVELAYLPGMRSFDYLKSAVRMFLNEALYRILQSAPPDAALFRYVDESLQLFEEHDFVPDFHLRFLWRLTHFLGCAPLGNCSESSPFFNVETAQFLPVRSDAEAALSAWIPRWTEDLRFPDTAAEVLPAPFRSPMLECLLSYYSRHVTTAVSGIQSHKVLKEMLR